MNRKEQRTTHSEQHTENGGQHSSPSAKFVTAPRPHADTYLAKARVAGVAGVPGWRVMPS